MPKRQILFKVAILAALVLGLVPASVLASAPTQVRGADTGMDLAAQSGTGVAVTGAARIDADVNEVDVAAMRLLQAVAVSKTADPTSLPEPGGTVTFTVGVTNTSVRAVTLTSLVDDVHGNLDGQGTCALNQTIAAGDAYQCAFTADVTGSAGDSEVDTITVVASDGEGNSAVIFADATVIITGNVVVAVNATQQLQQHAALTVTKAVNWRGVTPDASQEFTICVEGPTYPSGNCQTADYDGGDLVWSGLILGVYTVTETNPGAEWEMAISGSPATVPEDGGSASADVTNTRRLGSLEVTKAVNWRGVTPDVSQEFTICVEGPTYPSGNCQTADYDGGDLVWSGLIPGVYTVTETNPGAEWEVAISGSPATVPEDGGSASAGVTNTRRLGSLEVAKTADWNGVTPDASEEFTICVEGPSYPSGNCQTADYDGGDLVWSGLIPGVYTVTETNPGAEWEVAISGSPATVPEDGGSASASVANVRKLSWLEVTKTVGWGKAAPDGSQTFTICIEGPSYPAGDCQTVGHTGGSPSWSDLIPGDYTVTETDPGAEWEVTIADPIVTVPDDGTGASTSISNYNGGSTVYLPLMTNRHVSPAPDLVVEHIAVTSGSAQVVIKNQGNAPVSSSDPFWVDLYVDPDPVPTGVNQTWSHLCSQGIAWGVEAPALPLEPGGTITLTIGDAYYWAEYSNLPGSLPAGTPIYVQVDSADVQTTYGAVLENHEIVGGAYNNIAGPVFSTLVAAGEELVPMGPPVLDNRPPASSRRLPPRP